jgi:SAM-dependent methyltransferase
MWYERPLGRLADAIAWRVAARLGDGPPEPTGPPAAAALYPSFHDFLHAQRSVELSRMPKPARVLLSAGCSGVWYFDWMARWYGPVERHVGVERFLPRPDALPATVEWIASSVAAMPGVADGSVDLLFSGQNVEHLFGDDLVGFLLEAARVVRPGGHLVMDSPHREIVNLLVWSMNEHTIEFTPEEARALVELAGFDPTSLRGVWLCRDPDDGAALPLDPFAAALPADEVLRRVQLAARHPEHAFIWWLEARRAARAPDADELRRRHAEIFRVAWPERCRRFKSEVGETRHEDGRRIVATAPGTKGFLLFGPYMPFAAGSYEVTFRLRRGGVALPADTVVAVLDALADGGGDPTLGRRELRAADLPAGRWTEQRLAFRSPELRWTGQLRVYSVGADALAVDTAVEVDDRTTAVWPSLARSVT